MVDILNTSLFSVRWDLRSVWSILTLGAQIYLLVFLGAAVFAIIRCARILWSLKQTRHGSGQETGMILARFEWRIHSLRQLLVLALLVFGVILASVAWLIVSVSWRGSFVALGIGSLAWVFTWFWYFRDVPAEEVARAAAELFGG